MEEFLEDYGVIDFTEEHYSFLNTMLENLNENIHDGRPCGFGECMECPYFQDNNIYDAYVDSQTVMQWLHFLLVQEMK